MKKKVAAIIGLIIIGIIFMGILGFKMLDAWEDSSMNPYPKGGRDTVAYFGNARVVILRGINVDDDNIYWVMHDRKLDTWIDYVDNYKDVHPYVYTIGDKGYTKLNYETGEYIQSTENTQFTSKDNEVFKELENTKDKIHKK